MCTDSACQMRIISTLVIHVALLDIGSRIAVSEDACALLNNPISEGSDNSLIALAKTVIRNVFIILGNTPD